MDPLSFGQHLRRPKSSRSIKKYCYLCLGENSRFYINEKGEKIADAYETCMGWDSPTRKGFVRFTKNGKIGIMHISGKILVSPQYTTLWSLYDSPLSVTGHGQKVHRDSHSIFGGTYGLINDDGEEVAPVKFSKIAYFYLDSDEKIIMNLNEKRDFCNCKKLVVLYQGKKAYVLYRDAKNKLGIRPESAYDEGSGLKPALVKDSLLALDVPRTPLGLVPDLGTTGTLD